MLANEFVETLEDIMIRRTWLNLEQDHGFDCLDYISNCLRKEYEKKLSKEKATEMINQQIINYKEYTTKMEKIINSNLKGKVIQSTIKRLLLSWLIVAPLSYLLVLLSINATTFIYVGLDLNRLLTPDQLFTQFMPALILLSTINIIILFLLPNLIIGYLLLYRRISVINSFIFLVMTIALYLYSFEPNFAYIIIGQLPLTFFFSLFFLFNLSLFNP